MERLTKRNYHDFAIPIRGTDSISMLQAINRLAAIEDILGDEYDLNRLREWSTSTESYSRASSPDSPTPLTRLSEVRNEHQ